MSLYRSIITFIIKFTWLMTPKIKSNQFSNYEEKSNRSSLSSSNKRNKKTEDVLTSIITVLICLALSKHEMSDGFNVFLQWYIIYQIWMNNLVEG